MNPICQTNYSSQWEKNLHENNYMIRQFARLKDDLFFEETALVAPSLVEQANKKKSIFAPAVIVCYSFYHRNGIALALQRIAAKYFIVFEFIRSAKDLSERMAAAVETVKHREIHGMILFAHGSEKGIYFQEDRLCEENVEFAHFLLPKKASIILVCCEVAKGFALKIAQVAAPRPVFASLSIIGADDIVIESCCSNHRISMASRKHSENLENVKGILMDKGLEIIDHSSKEQEIRIFQKKAGEEDVEVSFPCQSIAAAEKEKASTEK